MGMVQHDGNSNYLSEHFECTDTEETSSLAVQGAGTEPESYIGFHGMRDRPSESRPNSMLSEVLEDRRHIHTLADNELLEESGGEMSGDNLETLDISTLETSGDQNSGSSLSGAAGVPVEKDWDGKNCENGGWDIYKRGSGALVQTSSDTACDKGGREQFDNSVGACEMGQ